MTDTRPMQILIYMSWYFNKNRRLLIIYDTGDVFIPTFIFYHKKYISFKNSALIYKRNSIHIQYYRKKLIKTKTSSLKHQWLQGRLQKL